VWPVPATAKINQHYKAGSHLGIDIGASSRGIAGDAVVAAQSGKVVYSGWLNGYGYVVYINSILNGTPIQTRYAHLQSASYLKAGYTVNAGQWIEAMGNSGTSSGVHLHFEVRIRKSTADCIANADSTPVNPFNYVSY
jgi:murein DD-endopeptidase MepM/ murein hydrolase activator NlpD